MPELHEGRSDPPIVWPTGDFSIFSATSSDAAEILDVLVQTTDGLRSMGKHHWNGKHTLESVLQSIEAADVFLLRDSNRVAVATVTVSFSPPSFHQDSDLQFWSDPDASAAYVRRLAVIPKHQNNGVASRLLKLAEQYATLKEVAFTRLDTDPLFPEIVPYYIKRGYTVRGMRDGRPFFEKQLEVV